MYFLSGNELLGNTHVILFNLDLSVLRLHNLDNFYSGIWGSLHNWALLQIWSSDFNYCYDRKLPQVVWSGYANDNTGIVPDLLVTVHVLYFSSIWKERQGNEQHPVPYRKEEKENATEVRHGVGNIL